MSKQPAIEVVIWDLGGVILRTEDRSLRIDWEDRLDYARGSSTG